MTGTPVKNDTSKTGRTCCEWPLFTEHYHCKKTLVHCFSKPAHLIGSSGCPSRLFYQCHGPIGKLPLLNSSSLHAGCTHCVARVLLYLIKQCLYNASRPLQDVIAH